MDIFKQALSHIAQKRATKLDGDYEKDLAAIWDYYRSIKVMGKHPEQFNLYDLYEAE